jgi:hypothetical protein
MLYQSQEAKARGQTRQDERNSQVESSSGSIAFVAFLFLSLCRVGNVTFES